MVDELKLECRRGLSHRLRDYPDRVVRASVISKSRRFNTFGLVGGGGDRKSHGDCAERSPASRWHLDVIKVDQ